MLINANEILFYFIYYFISVYIVYHNLILVFQLKFPPKIKSAKSTWDNSIFINFTLHKCTSDMLYVYRLRWKPVLLQFSTTTTSIFYSNVYSTFSFKRRSTLHTPLWTMHFTIFRISTLYALYFINSCIFNHGNVPSFLSPLLIVELSRNLHSLKFNSYLFCHSN